jgi:hypothetical protein
MKQGRVEDGKNGLGNSIVELCAPDVKGCVYGESRIGMGYTVILLNWIMLMEEQCIELLVMRDWFTIGW